LNKSFSKGGFLAAFEALAKWKPHLTQGYQALAYRDSQNLFAQGRRAIYPPGSWDIGIFHQMNPKGIRELAQGWPDVVSVLLSDSLSQRESEQRKRPLECVRK